tara:strand:- start:673 stop:816 length:144 start_codon:yes stop_codon:yes gene_type:complete
MMGKVKEVYMMYYQGNMSIDKIAKVLNIEKQSVANLVHSIYFGDEEE